jgi:hypothetical protein
VFHAAVEELVAFLQGVVNDGEQRGCAKPTVAVTTLGPEWLAWQYTNRASVS